MALRRGGRLYVELGPVGRPDVPIAVAERVDGLDPETFVDEIARRGGRVEERETVQGDSTTEMKRTRMVVRWQR